MRQVLSTALVAVIVGALAGITAGTVAQAPAADDRVITPAGVNADKVDGKHAVAFTNKRGRRAGKLVATNRGGWLPSNIVQPLWHLIKNKPAGFADGVDDVGVSGIKVTYHLNAAKQDIAANAFASQTTECPTGAVPIAGQFYSQNGAVWTGRFIRDGNGWTTYARNTSAAATTFQTGVVCLSAEPSGRLTTASKGKPGR